MHEYSLPFSHTNLQLQSPIFFPVIGAVPHAGDRLGPEVVNAVAVNTLYRDDDISLDQPVTIHEIMRSLEGSKAKTVNLHTLRPRDTLHLYSSRVSSGRREPTAESMASVIAPSYRDFMIPSLASPLVMQVEEHGDFFADGLEEVNMYGTVLTKQEFRPILAPGYVVSLSDVKHRVSFASSLTNIEVDRHSRPIRRFQEEQSAEEPTSGRVQRLETVRHINDLYQRMMKLFLSAEQLPIDSGIPLYRDFRYQSNDGQHILLGKPSVDNQYIKFYLTDPEQQRLYIIAPLFGTVPYERAFHVMLSPFLSLDSKQSIGEHYTTLMQSLKQNAVEFGYNFSTQPDIHDTRYAYYRFNQTDTGDVWIDFSVFPNGMVMPGRALEQILVLQPHTARLVQEYVHKKMAWHAAPSENVFQISGKNFDITMAFSLDFSHLQQLLDAAVGK